MDEPRAVIREIDGHLVLDDPDALELLRAVAKHNCKATLDANGERIAHFVRRVSELGKSPAELVIFVLNVDDSLGEKIAESLMPGTNWQEIRDRGEVPFARGLAGRDGIQRILDDFDADAAKKLRDDPGLGIVVVDHGVCEVFTAPRSNR